MGSKGTSVRLREKKLKTGRISLYLQFYNSGTNKRKKEYLGLYLIPKPKDQIEKDHNKEIRSLANSILSKVTIEIQEGRFGFRSKKFDDLLFLPYFESLLEKKRAPSSKKNVGNWESTLSHLRRFTRDNLRQSY